MRTSRTNLRYFNSFSLAQFLTILMLYLCTASAYAEKRKPLINVIEIKREDTKCEEDADCAEVKLTCSPCECYGAGVNSNKKLSYIALRNHICESSPPIECTTECDPNFTFTCKNEACQLTVVKNTDENLEEEMKMVGPEDMVEPDDSDL